MNPTSNYLLLISKKCSPGDKHDNELLTSEMLSKHLDEVIPLKCRSNVTGALQNPKGESPNLTCRGKIKIGAAQLCRLSRARGQRFAFSLYSVLDSPSRT